MGLVVRLLVVACMTIATPVFALEEASSLQEAPLWQVDAEKSDLRFTGKEGDKAFTGHFKSFTPVIHFDEANLAASIIAVEIDMKSAKIGQKQKDSALPQSDWFFTKKFPTAKFESSEIVSVGEGEYKATGKLSIRDQTVEAELPFTLKIDGDKAVATGGLAIDRRDYGVGQGEFSSDEWIAASVEIGFEIHAIRN